MITFEKRVFVERPIQDVFDFVSDPANAAKWRSTIESAGWISEGSVGVGSRLRQVSKFMRRKQENTAEITAWEPPNRMAQKMVEGPPFEHAFELQSKHGGTDLTVIGNMEMRGIFKLVPGMVVRQSEKMLETELNTLKLLLEEK